MFSIVDWVALYLVGDKLLRKPQYALLGQIDIAWRCRHFLITQ